MLSGTLRTSDTGVVERTAKHFAHKVDVETDGKIRRMRIAAGTFELEPREGEVQVRLFPAGPHTLARLREVAESHLHRFVRDGGELDWNDAG